MRHRNNSLLAGTRSFHSFGPWIARPGLSLFVVITMVSILTVGRNVAFGCSRVFQDQTVEPSASVVTAQQIFDFRSGFWINLHHFLYLQAVLATPQARKGVAETSARDAFAWPAMSAEQKGLWDKATSFYARYGNRDALMDRELIQVNYELSDAGNAPSLSGRQLPPELTAVLEEAAPVYRALWWTDHDRRNHAWIDATAKLIGKYGAVISSRIAATFRTEWPHEKTTVEVVVYANWAGAYTVTNGTLITISSTDSVGQDEAALENIFHEATHALIDGVQRQLYSDLRALGKTPNFDIVHVIIFYTAGTITADALGTTGRNNFVPYAVKNGLYDRAPNWKRYKEICERDWKPYRDGKVQFDAALSQIARDF